MAIIDRNIENEWFDSIVGRNDSLEKYLHDMIKDGAEPLLYGVRPFEYLIENNLLIEGDIIRTNLEGRCIDGHYEIISDTELKDVPAAGGQYSGRKGVFDYKEVLSLNVADNGWNLPFFAKNRVMLKVRSSERDKGL